MNKFLNFSFLIIIFTSCESITLDLKNSQSKVLTPVEIIQNSLAPADGIELNSEELLTNSNRLENSTYIRTTYTLSKFSSSPSFEIEGLYADVLSTSDITNLASIGLTNADSSSTKGSITNLSKNLSEDIDLAFNIKIQSSIYSDAAFSNLISSSSESVLYVGADNHIDGEYLTRVKGENYYLFHEWTSDQFSAVQLLPEGNYRRVALGTTSATQMDSFTFVDSIPEINSHQVGYTLNRNTTRNIYKVTNDGTGLEGWTHTLMSSVTRPYRLFPTDLSLNGEAVLVGKVRYGQYQNASFTILQWSGSTWTESLLGSDLKSRLGLSFDDSLTGASDLFVAPDGSYWMAISDATSGTIHSDNFFIRLEYNSGDITDLNNWSYETISIPDVGILDSMESNIQDIIFTSYTDKDNFTATIAGAGMAKVIVTAGVASYTPVSSHPDTSSYDLTLDFPTGRDTNGLSQITGCHAMAIDISDSNKIFCMGYTSMFTVDISNGDVEEVLGQIDNNSTVIYSR